MNFIPAVTLKNKDGIKQSDIYSMLLGERIIFLIEYKNFTKDNKNDIYDLLIFNLLASLDTLFAIFILSQNNILSKL